MHGLCRTQPTMLFNDPGVVDQLPDPHRAARAASV